MYILISKCTSISLGPHNFPFAFSSDFAEVHLGARKKMSLRLFYLGLLDIICSTLHRSGHDNFRRMLPTDSEENYNDNNGLKKNTNHTKKGGKYWECLAPSSVLKLCWGILCDMRGFRGDGQDLLSQQIDVERIPEGRKHEIHKHREKIGGKRDKCSNRQLFIDPQK